MNWHEFNIIVSGQTLTISVIEPRQLAKQPALLLNFAADRVTNLRESPYDISVQTFLANGHRAASFDLPCHGDRIDAGRSEGIAGFCEEFLSGTDVFARFVEEGRMAIDELIRRKWAELGRIFVSGTSRGGYCALQLMADDTRITAGAAFAPVTDWRELTEFQSIRHRADLADLRLSCFAEKLAGRPIYLAIGNHDDRVSTASCCQFFLDLNHASLAKGMDRSKVDFYCTPDLGHSCGDDWRCRGGEFLLNQLADPVHLDPKDQHDKNNAQKEPRE